MSDTADQVWALTIELAQHHRIDPNTSRDRCTCGYRTGLGRMFSEHIAEQIVAQGWEKR